MGTTLLAGLGVSAVWGFGEARAHWAREARAAQASHALLGERLAPPAKESAVALTARAHAVPTAAASRIEVARPEPGPAPAAAVEAAAEIEIEPGADIDIEPTPTGQSPYLFDPARDEELLAPLRHGGIQSVKYNRGGSSISLRIDFDNGARGAFKPRQAARQTIPRKEIAAFRLDRLLGLHVVPPAIGRKLDKEAILAAVEPGSAEFLPRLREEMFVDDDGLVTGEISWWIPVIETPRIDGFDVDSTNGIVTWKRYLSVGKPMPEDQQHLLGQLSSMILFDFIINNPDRWSGGNVKMSADGKVLYFMDNTLSFGLEATGHRKCQTYLTRVQKFSRRLVAALRTLTEEQIRQAIDKDRGPFEALLTESEIEALMQRREYALTYIDDLIAQHGEAAVLVFP